MNENKLLEIVSPIVNKLAGRESMNDADRDDLQQDAIAKYLETFPGDSAPDNVAAWFQVATKRRFIDVYRARARRPQKALPENGDDPVSNVLRDLRLSRTTSFQPVRETLIRSILELIPRADADLLQRRYLEGHSAADLALELGIEVSTVDQRTTRAKRRLRAALESRPDLVEELHQPHPRLYE